MSYDGLGRDNQNDRKLDVVYTNMKETIPYNIVLLVDIGNNWVYQFTYNTDNPCEQ